MFICRFVIMIYFPCKSWLKNAYLVKRFVFRQAEMETRRAHIGAAGKSGLHGRFPPFRAGFGIPVWRLFARFAVAALTGFRQGCSRQGPHCPSLHLPRRVLVHSQHVPEYHHRFRPKHERQNKLLRSELRERGALAEFSAADEKTTPESPEIEAVGTKTHGRWGA
jgi:hypothetical protein